MKVQIITMSAQKTHVLELMTPLLVIGYFGGTISMNRWARFHKIYASVLLFALVLSYIHVSYGKWTPIFKDFSFLVIFSDQLALLFLSLGCCSCIISVFFVNVKSVTCIINCFAFFDQRIGVPMRIRYKYFWTIFILSNLEIIGLLIADSTIWLDSLGIQLYIYYIIRNFQMYFMEMRRMLIYWVSVEICLRFRVLVASLKNNFRSFPQKEIFLFRQTELLKSVKRISHLHNCLCDVTDFLNKLYGVALLFDILFALALSLEYSILMITYTVIFEEIRVVRYGIALKSVCCMWIAECLVSILGFLIFCSFFMI